MPQGGFAKLSYEVLLGYKKTDIKKHRNSGLIPNNNGMNAKRSKPCSCEKKLNNQNTHTETVKLIMRYHTDSTKKNGNFILKKLFEIKISVSNPKNMDVIEK
jgi:hypothetical protein